LHLNLYSLIDLVERNTLMNESQPSRGNTSPYPGPSMGRFGAQRKQPQLFLAGIDTCEVLEDDGETVLREVKFKMVFLYPPTSPPY
jgi:hypothetical protein